MKRFLCSMIGAAACAGVLWAAEPMPDNPASPIFKIHQQANHEKIAKLTKNDLTWFTVPPLNDVMRLPDRYPSDGQFEEPLRIVAAQGEYEPASFVLYSSVERKNISVNISDLKNSAGDKLPAPDMKVVKVWYQCGNGWYSYFADNEFRLCPELLLHDENMIKVDFAKSANYARILNGKDVQYIWINTPPGMKSNFNHMQKGFADADKLQPISLKKDEFKQIFVTVAVPKSQKPGVYSGKIDLCKNGKQLLSIPVYLRVLPFELPTPRVLRNIDRVYLSSCMGRFSWKNFEKQYGDRELAAKKYREFMANLKAHNFDYPCVDQDERSIALLKELGFPTEPWIGESFCPWFSRNFGGKLHYDERQIAKDSAKLCSEFYKKQLGHNNILLQLGDEQDPAFVVCNRSTMQEYRNYGMSMGFAGDYPLFQKAGYASGYHPFGGCPEAPERTRRWNDLGDSYIGFYAGQHSGAENPALIRRQNGLVSLYFNATMNCNFAFWTAPWNDMDAEVYRPFLIAYQNYGGLVDTLAYEGFREAVDDIRYISKLKLLARDAKKSADSDVRILGRKALQYLAAVDSERDSMDQVRSEVICHILKLISAMGGKD